MKQKEIFKKIGGIIQELSDQYEYLKTVENDLNDLELELFVSNAHFLTDHIEILCKLNLQNGAAKPAPIAEKPEKEEKTERLEKPKKPDRPEKQEEEERQESPYEQKYFEPVVQQMKLAARSLDAKPPRYQAKQAEIETPNPVQDQTPKVQDKPVEIEIVKPVEDQKTEILFKPIEAEIIEPVEDQPVPNIDLGSDAPMDTYSFIREEPEVIRHELVLDETSNLDDEENLPIEGETIKDVLEEKAESPVIEEEPKPTTANEDINIPKVKSETLSTNKTESDDVLTINQKISSQLGDKATSKTEQLSIKPVSDIKLAITLNDKLLYVKDLFNGYNLAYSEAIEILNRFDTFEEASRFLKTNYVTKNNWDSKPATTEKFYALLKRRYA